MRLQTLLLSLLLIPSAPRALGAEVPSIEALPLTSFALVGMTLQQVLLKFPAPAGVFLAGEDAEIPRPAANDPVVFRYEREVLLAGSRPAWIVVVFDPSTYRVSSVVVEVRADLSFDTVIEWLDRPVYTRERRRVESDDFDIWFTDEIDPEGAAEVLFYPDLGLEISHIDGMPYIHLRFR